MKRLFTSFLFMMAGAFMTTALADSYNIWVGGVRVTDTNMSNINPSGKTSGTITYDSSSKTLTFTGVTMSTDKCCIDVEMDGVTVYFNGVNNFTSTAANTFYAKQPVTLDGPRSDGTLAHAQVTFNCTASGYYSALWFKGSGTFDIFNLYLTAKGNYYAIQGPDDSSQSATIRTSCAEIVATAGLNTVGAVMRFKDWEMLDKGSLINGNIYNSTSMRTVDSKGNNASSVTLKNGLYVGKQMVRAGATRTWVISPSGKTAGTISYVNNTLTLSNVTYSGSNCFIDNYNVDGLVINSTGTNNITCTSENGLSLRANTTLAGDGTLKITSTSKSAISTYNDCDVAIRIGSLEAKGNLYGFFGQRGGSLTLDKYSSNSTYKFLGGTCNVFTGKLVMNLVDIWTNNTYFNAQENMLWSTDKSGVAHGTDISDDGSWFKANTAFTYYPLYVAGTHVNNRNNNNVLSPYITGGKVSYDLASNKLTLDGVQFEATGTNAPKGIIAQKALGDVTLNFTGADQHWTTDNDVIDLGGSTTISGDCMRVYLTSNKKSGIITRDEATVTINTTGYFGSKGAEYGYYGDSNDSETLTLSKTTEDTFGYEFDGADGAIYNLRNLRLNNMDFGYIDGNDYLPGCYFDKDYSQVSQNGGTLAKGKVTFLSIKEALPIYVAGKQLNVTRGDNTIYVGSPYISSGAKSVKYVTSTKTLTLDNATIEDHGDAGTVSSCGIAVLDEGVKIEVVGTNNINAGNHGIYSTKSLTINGSGNLNVASSQRGALAMYDTANAQDLILQCSGGTHTFKGKTYGFIGWNTANLIIQKSSGSGALYKFAGETYDIGSVNELSLGDGVRIHSRYTWFNEEEKAIYRNYGVSRNSDLDDGTWIRGDVEWIDYPLAICGHQLYGVYVDGQFKGPASGFSCKEHPGSGIYYDPENNVLNISGDCAYSGYIVESGIEDLTINVNGNSTLTETDGASVIRLYASTTITGGKLTLKSEAEDDDALGIYLSDGETLTIKDADVEVVGDGFEYGITGESDCSLLIDNSDVSVSAHSWGCFSDWGGITLINSFIKEPETSIIYPDGIYDVDDNLIGGTKADTETVVIKAGELTGLNSASANGQSSIVNSKSIYDLNGQKVANPEKGKVYIVNGKAIKY